MGGKGRRGKRVSCKRGHTGTEHVGRAKCAHFEQVTGAPRHGSMAGAQGHGSKAAREIGGTEAQGHASMDASVPPCWEVRGM